MICIFNKNETVFTYNGLAVLEPSECIFKPSINGVWSLEMTVPYAPDGKYLEIENEKILKITGIDCIAEQTASYQLFRIYDHKKQDDSVYVLAYPIGLDARFDTFKEEVRIFNKTAAEALSQINGLSNKYTVTGSGYGSDTASIEYQKANLIQIINGSDSDVNNTTYKSFVNTYDGEICYDNYNIKINHRLGSNLTPIDVRYGKNITGMSYDLDNSNVITRLYPYAKSGEAYNGIDEYKMEDNRYRDAPNASDYPIPHIYYVETPDTLIQTSNDGSMTYQRTMAFFNNIKATVGNWLRDALLDEATGDEILEVVELDWINQMYALTTDKDNVEGIVEHMWKKVVNDTTYPLKSATFKNLIYSAMKAGFDNVLKSDGTLYIGTSSKKWFSGEEIDHDFYSYTWDVYGRYRANKRGLAEYLWVYANSKWRQVDVYGYGTGATDDSKWKWYKNKKTDTYKHYGNKKKKRYLHDEWWKINDVWYEFDGDGKSIKGSALYNYNIDLFDNAKVFDSRRGNVTLYDYLIPYCKEQEEYFFHQLYLSMYAYCNGMFEEQGLSYPIPKIEINIVDLSQTIEYSSYQNLEKIKLGNTVNVTNPKIGVNPKELRVTGLTYDVLRKCNTKIQIGVTESTVINMLNEIGKGSDNGARLIAGQGITIENNVISVELPEKPYLEDVIVNGESMVSNHVAYIDLDEMGIDETIDVIQDVEAPDDDEGEDKDFFVHMAENGIEKKDAISIDKYGCHTSESNPIILSNYDNTNNVYSFDINGKPSENGYGETAWFVLQNLEVGKEYTISYDVQYSAGTTFPHSDHHEGVKICGTVLNHPPNTNKNHITGTFTYVEDGQARFEFYQLTDNVNFTASFTDFKIEGSYIDSFDEIYNKYDERWLKYVPKVMTGATAQEDGESGTVPAPQIADKDKFLKGDGTWAEAAGAIADLSDVYLNNLADGEVLKYNNLNRKWVNGTAGADVSITPSLQSGTKVCDYEINGISGVLYSLTNTTGDYYNPIIYSTDEREVGVWIDNKPLYQKTVTTNGSVPSGATLISRVVINSSYDLLLYTKTTDTAGSGSYNTLGVPMVHYTTSEQVIGTWIDGKPLYQKTIDCGAVPNSTTKNVAHNIANINKIIQCYGIAFASDGSIRPMPHLGNNNWTISLWADKTNIKIQTWQNWASTCPNSYVTIRYTKTTD